MAVSVLTSRIGTGFPFAQEEFTALHTVFRVAPSTGVLFGGQTAVELREAVVEQVEVGLRDFRIAAEHFDGALGVGEEVVNELLCVGHTVFLSGTMLRRVFLRADIGVVFLVEHEAIEPELGGAQHGGEGTLEIVAVEGVTIVLPEVGAIPSVGNDIVVGKRTYTAEDIVFGVASPTALLSGGLGITSPFVVDASRHIDDVVEERQVHFAQVGRLGRPVVHLHVDV